MNKRIYGLSTSLSGEDCYLDRLDQLKAEGISCLELCLREDLEQERALLPDALASIRQQGLTVWSIHLPYGESVNPAQPDEAKRLKNVEQLERFLAVTEPIGAKIYVIHGSAEPVPHSLRASMLGACVQSLRTLTARLRAEGRILALENLPRTCIGNTAGELEAIAEQVEGLAFCFDSNHFTPQCPRPFLRFLQRKLPALRKRVNPVADNPAAWIQRFSNRIVTVHMSDYDGIDECHWIPGQGIVDFAGIAAALDTAGFTAPILFEPNEVCRGVPTTALRLIQGYEQSLNGGTV